MKRARFFSVIIFAATVLYGSAGFYSLPLASYNGDLTRIGKLPETLFGWTRPQPAIAPEFLRQASWQEADVLVIGDSFSASRVWQSVLVAHGLKVRTEPWMALCEDIAPRLRAQGFRGKHVVIEIVERNLKDFLDKSVECRKMAPLPDVAANTVLPPAPVFDHDRKDYSGRMSVGIKTWINMLKYERLAAEPNFKSRAYGDVNVIRVAQGCSLFSHQRCQDGLFYKWDNGEREPGDEAMHSMEIVHARLDGMSPIWAVVPDKSTAYLYPGKQFWEAAGKRLHSVNLLKPVRQAVQDKIIDLYPANNTHFSTTGYLIMGREIYRSLDLDSPGQ